MGYNCISAFRAATNGLCTLPGMCTYVGARHRHYCSNWVYVVVPTEIECDLQAVGFEFPFVTIVLEHMSMCVCVHAQNANVNVNIKDRLTNRHMCIQYDIVRSYDYKAYTGKVSAQNCMYLVK